MSEYFPKPKSSGGSVKFELDFSNYATKADLKNATGADTSKFAEKVDFADSKSDVDKLDIDKLKNVPTNLSNLKYKVDKLDVHKLAPVPVDLSKRSDAVKNNVVKKDVYNPKIKNIDDKIPDITNLATNTTLNDKINEIEKEITSITNLAPTTAFNAKISEVKNKIPNVSNLVKKTDHNTKISEIGNKITTDHVHDEYIITEEFNKLTAENCTARLIQANLASKSGSTNFVKKKQI